MTNSTRCWPMSATCTCLIPPCQLSKGGGASPLGRTGMCGVGSRVLQDPLLDWVITLLQIPINSLCPFLWMLNLMAQIEVSIVCMERLVSTWYVPIFQNRCECWRPHNFLNLKYIGTDLVPIKESQLDLAICWPTIFRTHSVKSVRDLFPQLLS